MSTPTNKPTVSRLIAETERHLSNLRQKLDRLNGTLSDEDRESLQLKIQETEKKLEEEWARPARSPRLDPPKGSPVFKLRMDRPTEKALEFLMLDVDSSLLGRADGRRLNKGAIFRLAVQKVAEEFGLETAS